MLVFIYLYVQKGFIHPYLILSINFFAGLSSKTSSPVSFQGSPVSARATEGGLISVQYYAFPSASEPDGPDSGSPKYVYYSYCLSNYVPSYVLFCFIILSHIRTIVVWQSSNSILLWLCLAV